MRNHLFVKMCPLTRLLAQGHSVFGTHACQFFPSPSTGEGEGGGEGRRSVPAVLLPPIPTFPRQGEGAPLNTRCAPPSADAVAGNGVEDPGKRGENRELNGPASLRCAQEGGIMVSVP